MVEGLAMRLKIERIKKGLQQKDVATRTGIDRSSISSYEGGNTSPPCESLMKLAKLYDTSTDFLLGITHDRVIDVSGLREEQIKSLQQVANEFINDNELISG